MPAARLPFQEPDLVTSMPHRSLIFFGIHAYDLLATMNHLFGHYQQGLITESNWNRSRLDLENLRYNDIRSEDMPLLECPYCPDAPHYLEAETWFADYGVEAYLEDVDDDIQMVQARMVPIDLTYSDTDDETDETLEYDWTEDDQEAAMLLMDILDGAGPPHAGAA